MFQVSGFLQKSFIALTLAAVSGLRLQAADAPKPVAPKPGEPTDPQALKTYASAVDWLKNRNYDIALNEFRKANKLDGGHCWLCLSRAYDLAMKMGAYKDAIAIGRELVPAVESDPEKAYAHFRLAMALQQQGYYEKKDKQQQCFTESRDEFKTALQLDPKFAGSHYYLGIALANLFQDDEARTQFNAFLDQDRKNPALHQRAERFVERIDLARASMAPPFSLTTSDGQRISMDGLAGKVVLIDFWATWCGPCREALPRIRSIAKKFDGQPLVVLSISLDSDPTKWKDFVEKNGMTWLQYRDGGFGGKIAKQFGVTAIPATFTIDADGVLEDQHVGDASIEGKIKKLVAQAVELANKKPAPTADQSAGNPPAASSVN